MINTVTLIYYIATQRIKFQGHTLLYILKGTICLQHKGQWKQCCDDLMKIELPSPRKPAPVTPKQGSLYHEMGKTFFICNQKTFLVTFSLKKQAEDI